MFTCWGSKQDFWCDATNDAVTIVASTAVPYMGIYPSSDDDHSAFLFCGFMSTEYVKQAARQLPQLAVPMLTRPSAYIYDGCPFGGPHRVVCVTTAVSTATDISCLPVGMH